MSAPSITAFDPIARGYDQLFSHTLIGKTQRQQSRRWLYDFIRDKRNLRILEINCGTGDDALWLASLGHTVVATDASEQMIEEAKKKFPFTGSPPRFLHSSFAQLPNSLPDEKFDLIFSNFSGLNCINSHEMSVLNSQLARLLHNDGHLAAVIFGKYCWWETLYFLLRLLPTKAFRRWRSKMSTAILKEGSEQPVYYYSTKRFCRLCNRFRLVRQKPVGLFIPPSYLEPSMKKRPGLFNFLKKLEDRAGSISSFSQFADHTYLLLKKDE